MTFNLEEKGQGKVCGNNCGEKEQKTNEDIIAGNVLILKIRWPVYYALCYPFYWYSWSLWEVLQKYLWHQVWSRPSAPIQLENFHSNDGVTTFSILAKVTQKRWKILLPPTKNTRPFLQYWSSGYAWALNNTREHSFLQAGKLSQKPLMHSS